jgi:hypothetical protein
MTYLSPQLIMPLEEEVIFPGDAEAVAEVVETTLVVMAEEINSSSLRTSFLCVSFVARLVMWGSNATSALILIIWEKTKVLMLHTHMKWTLIGMHILVQHIT